MSSYRYKSTSPYRHVGISSVMMIEFGTKTSGLQVRNGLAVHLRRKPESSLSIYLTIFRDFNNASLVTDIFT